MNEATRRSLAAVMFTDMVGYTALMQEDEALALVRRKRHREVLEETHARFQGKIIQYFGDGTLSVFDSVVDAVRCGIEIQLALKEEPKVPLRIGLHTGDIVFSEEEIIGDGVNIASRLESFAVPGAILVSEKVEDDIRNHPDIQTESVGIFELKNVTKPMEIFAIANQGLVVPLAEEISGKGKLLRPENQHLPVRLTSFIGREVEVAQVKSLLLQHRLVTLTGPGGTGKTSLSIGVAEEVISHFKDGVFFIPLAPIHEADLLASAIASILMVAEVPNQPVLEAIKTHLQDKELLLVLDNFEQIVDASSEVLELLHHCPQLKILVSSRIVLRIKGEQEYPVQPLTLPDIRQLIKVDLLEQFPSVRLFVERSRTVKPEFELTSENALEVAEICNRLDGLPLAIELAAARMRLFSSKTLLQKLTKSLDILKSKDKGRPERHQTLRQTISWSYDLLSSDEQLLFQKLAVFTGTFTLEAVEAICKLEDLEELDVYEGMEAFLEKSLIRQVVDNQRDTRFLLLETIKEFAWDKLLGSGDAGELKERHARFFLEFVEEAAPELTGKDQTAWIDRIDANYDNIRSAILWILEEQVSEMGFRYSNALWRYWLVRNQVEGFDRLNQILRLPLKEELEIDRAKTLSAMGSTLNATINPQRGGELLKESIAIFRKYDQKPDLALSLNHLGHSAIQVCKYELAIQLTNEALAIGQSLKLERAVSSSHNNLGYSHLHLGNWDQARHHFTEGVNIRKRINDARGYSFILTNLAWTESHLGEYEKATSNFDKALQIANEQAAGPHVINWIWVTQIENYVSQGKWAAAKSLLPKTAKIRAENVYVTVSTMALILEAEILTAAEEFEFVEEILEKAEHKITSFGNNLTLGMVLKARLRAKIRQGLYEEAKDIAKTAASLFFEVKNHFRLAEVLELIAQLKFKQELPEQAARALITAKVLRKKKNLFLRPRFVDRLTELEFALKEKLGDPGFERIEKILGSGYEDEISTFW